MKTSRLSCQIAALVGALSVSFASFAAIVDSGSINVSIPATGDGIYYNVVTGATGVTAATAPAGWDLNIYLTTTNLGFFWPPAPAGGVITGTVFDNLANGAVISAASTFSRVTAATGYVNFQSTGIRTMGFAFVNEAGGLRHFGYVQIDKTGPTGFPATIKRIVFESTAETAVTVTAGGAGGGPTITPVPVPAAAATPAVIAARTLPVASATSTFTLSASAASSTTCATTSAGYSVAPSVSTVLPAATAVTFTVTQNSAAAGTFLGAVTCTNAAGATPASFVYNFTHTVNPTVVVVAPLIPTPALNIWGALALLAGLGLFGAFAARRFS
jgi:hypothetical protein